jgi:ribosomal-protein-serine acetyltransferase
MVLTDGVVSLEPPRHADAEPVAEAVQDSIATLSEWLPWATPDYSAVTALDWIRASRAAGNHSFVIRDPRGVIVGTCGLQAADEANRCIQLGYWVGRTHGGRGYATRGARLVIDHAFVTLEMHRIEILVSVHNEPSQRVAERLGARREATLRQRLLVRGEWHDAHLYSVIA